MHARADARLQPAVHVAQVRVDDAPVVGALFEHGGRAGEGGASGGAEGGGDDEEERGELHFGDYFGWEKEGGKRGIWVVFFSRGPMDGRECGMSYLYTS